MRKLVVLLSATLGPIVGAQTPGAVTIGGARAVSAEFGEIRDVAILPGLVVVLDKNAPHLRIFDLTGRLLQTTGRRGAGPGEFSYPFSVSYDALKKLVYVVDPANSRVVEYSLAADTLRFARSLVTSVVNLRDICFVRERIFGISASRSQLLDELSISDGRLVSVGTLGKPQSQHPLGEHRMVIYRTSDGPLLCDEEAGLVWVSSEILGEVNRIEVANGTQTMIPIPGFQPMRLEAVGDGRLALSKPVSGFYNVVVSVIPDSPTIKVVVGRTDGDTMTEFDVISLGAGANSGARVRSSWQQVGTVAGNVVCVVNDPYPTLSLFKARACP